MNVSTLKTMSEAALIAAVLSVPGFIQLAEARGGGGFGGGFYGGGGSGSFHDDGGFSGGSLRGDGGVAARGPDGGAVAVGPNGGVAAQASLEAYGNYYYGGGGEYYYAGATPGAVTDFAVGTAVASLSAAATSTVVAGQTYYSDNGIYYQRCYQGAAEVYCVVSPP